MDEHHHDGFLAQIPGHRVQLRKRGNLLDRILEVVMILVLPSAVCQDGTATGPD